jgi:hypothetical protein
VTDIVRQAIADFRDDLARAHDVLETAIENVVDIDPDDILKELDGVFHINVTAFDLLDRLAEAPEAVTTAFREFDWQVSRALTTLQQAFVREMMETRS